MRAGILTITCQKPRQTWTLRPGDGSFVLNDRTTTFEPFIWRCPQPTANAASSESILDEPHEPEPSGVETNLKTERL